MKMYDQTKKISVSYVDIKRINSYDDFYQFLKKKGLNFILVMLFN